jgi:bifunctional UDP-N-acetylglucosamine pyrophosphorylase/glucosamine-1-phosphate N-acetyltransferase
VSPVTVKDGAMVAAGSTLTQDVEQDALAVGRSKERILSKWAKKYRERNKK